MRFRAYPAFKPSGVGWLGDVPAHWSVKRLKFTARFSVSNVDKVPAEDELPVRLCNYTDVYNNQRIHPDMGLMETTATAAEIRRFGLHVGDVLLTKDSEEWTDIAVPAIVERAAADLVCGYHLAIVRADERSLRGSFLLRLMQSLPINRHFQVSADGVTRFGLPKSAIGDARLPLPPPEEQAAIASFLDRETARIEVLVAKKRELVEKLEEKRAALISRAVTRGLPPDAARAAGLNPHPKLKPCGVEWLGDIPEQWGTRPLRYSARFLGGATPDKSNPAYWDGVIPWISPKDMKKARIDDAEDHISVEAVRDSPLSIIPPRTVLIVVRGMILAHSLPLAITGAPVTVNQDIKGLLVGPDLTPEFLFWVLCGGRRMLVSLAEESAHGTKKLGTRTLGSFSLPLPRPTEQRAITAYLDHETTKLDELTATAERAIDRLLEYRSALITAAVTGKIDVRGMRDGSTGSGGTLQP